MARATAKATAAPPVPKKKLPASAAKKTPVVTMVVASKKKAVPAKSPAKQPSKAVAKKAPAKGKASPMPKVALKAAAMLKKPPVAVKKAATRRPATRPSVATPAARRRLPPTARKAPARKLAAGKPQTFTVSHLNHEDFKADGLRAYALYRDLGIAAATGGLCQAHVIRMIPPCTDEVRKPHLHNTELQLVYVLKGWMKNEFEGHGVQMMSAGSCWLQPSGIKHTVLDYSPDCELLEVIVPADFTTKEV